MFRSRISLQCLALPLALTLHLVVVAGDYFKPFNVTYDHRALIIDGQRRILISAGIHYPRATPQMWPDLITKSKEGGADVIQTYAFWNGHEPFRGQYNFEGRGFPVWLHDVPGRTDNPAFKIENEYGVLKGPMAKKGRTMLNGLLIWLLDWALVFHRLCASRSMLQSSLSGSDFCGDGQGSQTKNALQFSLNKRPPENMSDLLDRVEKYLRAEEDSTTLHQEEIHAGQKRRDRPEGKNQYEPKHPRALLSKSFTPLNTTREHILHQIKGQNILKWPKPMRGPAERRDTQVYCHFHKDHGHTAKECKVLQREIENLIAKGHLKQFVKTNHRQQTRGRNNPRRADEAPPKDPPVINTIFGGPSADRLSSSSRKAYARQVNHTQGPAKRTKASTSLEFDDADLDGVSLLHDALVITLRIDAFQVKRILVNTGSSPDIIFEDAFNQMGISDDRVKPMSSPLYGFTGASAPVKGIAPLIVVAGEGPRQAVHTLDFLIVKVKLSYNKILGRTGLNKLQAIALTYHLIMKFPTLTGVGFVKRDQILARRCYVASFKAEETLSIDDQRDEKALRRAEPVETLVSIPIIEGDEERQSPPLLSKPIPGEDLFLYLAVAEFAVSAVLIREQDRRQLPIYYASKVLQGAKQRYPNAEKLAFALLIAARKLRLYFQSHTIIVLTDKPLRRILHKPDLLGRLVPWSIELGEFDIHYRPRPLIKGQALADFIIECTFPIEDEEPLPSAQPELFTWTLFMDGSSNTSGSVPYLRCLTPSEANYPLREVHEGICGQHLGVRALAQKVLRQGYYWPTMHRDALDYTKKCDACQCFSLIPKQSPSPLSSLSSPIPFAMWGMDIMGPFPSATAQRRFVIVAIDYFTKWAEAEA
ncbi:hypothetical protein RJ639_016354 [Escallonia herrerae]|uniref:beta-galactosidase n=1 Tax=Escallonia herrerae TaxID=1293975 RepID=A0AA88VBA4_9ASTE|nr:hypothetical protein RJ639_016354 [Escallonia herrerae]